MYSKVSIVFLFVFLQRFGPQNSNSAFLCQQKLWNACIWRVWSFCTYNCVQALSLRSARTGFKSSLRNYSVYLRAISVAFYFAADLIICPFSGLQTVSELRYAWIMYQSVSRRWLYVGLIGASFSNFTSNLHLNFQFSLSASCAHGIVAPKAISN